MTWQGITFALQSCKKTNSCRVSTMLKFDCWVKHQMGTFLGMKRPPYSPFESFFWCSPSYLGAFDVHHLLNTASTSGRSILSSLWYTSESSFTSGSRPFLEAFFPSKKPDVIGRCFPWKQDGPARFQWSLKWDVLGFWKEFFLKKKQKLFINSSCLVSLWNESLYIAQPSSFRRSLVRWSKDVGLGLSGFSLPVVFGWLGLVFEILVLSGAYVNIFNGFCCLVSQTTLSFVFFCGSLTLLNIWMGTCANAIDTPSSWFCGRQNADHIVCTVYNCVHNMWIGDDDIMYVFEHFYTKSLTAGMFAKFNRLTF